MEERLSWQPERQEGSVLRVGQSHVALERAGDSGSCSSGAGGGGHLDAACQEIPVMLPLRGDSLSSFFRERAQHSFFSLQIRGYTRGCVAKYTKRFRSSSADSTGAVVGSGCNQSLATLPEGDGASLEAATPGRGGPGSKRTASGCPAVFMARLRRLQAS